jgi:hypothetical protein
MGVTLPVSMPSMITFAPLGKLDTLNACPCAVTVASSAAMSTSSTLGFFIFENALL